VKDIHPAKLATIAAACMVLIAVSYMCFLAATWVAFQSDRTTRMEKIDELLDRIPARSGRDTADATPGEVLRVRDTDQEASSAIPDPLRNGSGHVLREMPEQAAETSPDRDENI